MGRKGGSRVPLLRVSPLEDERGTVILSTARQSLSQNAAGFEIGSRGRLRLVWFCLVEMLRCVADCSSGNLGEYVKAGKEKERASRRADVSQLIPPTSAQGEPCTLTSGRRGVVVFKKTRRAPDVIVISGL